MPKLETDEEVGLSPTEQSAPAAARRMPKSLEVSTRMMLKSVLLVIAYLLGGAAVYMPTEGWTFVDCMYFGVVTITTVGYGDLYPTTRDTKAFTAIYGLVGIGMITVALGKVSRWIVEHHNRTMANHSDAVLQSMQSATASISEGGPGGKRLKLVATVRTKTVGACMVLPNCAKKLVPRVVMYHLHNASTLVTSFIPIVLFISFFGGVLGYIEGWNVADSLYLSVITVTSIGYGDLSPKSQEGRLFATFFIPLGVSLIAKAIADFVVGLIGNKFRSPEVTLAKLSGIDTRKKGVVTEGEYLTYMLVSLSKVDPKTLHVLREQFRVLESKCNGGKEGKGELVVQDLEKVLKSPTARAPRAVAKEAAEATAEGGDEIVAQQGKKTRVRAVI